jgi:hypothetical protein
MSIVKPFQVIADCGIRIDVVPALPVVLAG